MKLLLLLLLLGISKSLLGIIVSQRVNNPNEVSKLTSLKRNDFRYITRPIYNAILHCLWAWYNFVSVVRKHKYYSMKLNLENCPKNTSTTGWTKNTLVVPQFIIKQELFRIFLLRFQLLTHSRSNLTYKGSIWQKNISASPMASGGCL